MHFQWILLRLIRTPDKEYKSRRPLGVRINEVILYLFLAKLLYLVIYLSAGPVISKSMGKGSQSTRKIARKLNTNSNPVSHMTIYRYLKNCISAAAFKEEKIHRLSEKTSKTSQFFQEISKLEGRRLEKSSLVRRAFL